MSAAKSSKSEFKKMVAEAKKQFAEIGGDVLVAEVEWEICFDAVSLNTGAVDPEAIEALRLAAKRLDNLREQLKEASATICRIKQIGVVEFGKKPLQKLLFAAGAK